MLSPSDRFLVHSEVKEAFISLVADDLADRGGRFPEISGARAFVETLDTHPEVLVALVTGGWKETAMMKIRAIGLDPQALCLASASDAVSRVEIIRLAEQRALRGRQTERRAYFGDGPRDRRASQALGYDFIAIGEHVEHPARYSDFGFAETILTELGLGH